MKAFNKSLALLLASAIILIYSGEALAVGALFARPRFSSQQYQKMWIKKLDTRIDIQ